MTTIDLIMALSKLPPDLEVIYDNTQPEDEGFRMVVVVDAERVRTDNGEYVLLNAGIMEEENNENIE